MNLLWLQWGGWKLPDIVFDGALNAQFLLQAVLQSLDVVAPVLETSCHHLGWKAQNQHADDLDVFLGQLWMLDQHVVDGTAVYLVDLGAQDIPEIGLSPIWGVFHYISTRFEEQQPLWHREDNYGSQIDLLIDRNDKQTVLITTYGLKHNLYFDTVQNVVSADQLFER